MSYLDENSAIFGAERHLLCGQSVDVGYWAIFDIGGALLEEKIQNSNEIFGVYGALLAIYRQSAATSDIAAPGD